MLRFAVGKSLYVPSRSAATASRRLASTLKQRRRVQVPVGIGKAPMAVPLTVADLHLRHEQLPFAYFFRETLDAEALQESLTTILQEEFAVAGGRLSPSFQSINCTPEDCIPLSFCEIDCSLEEWQSNENNQGHKHQSGRGDHPELLPIFDPLLDAKTLLDQASLLSVRVTYFSCGATCLGVTMNHCLGDTASCIQLVQNWGREMRKKVRTSKVCWERAQATVSGMMTADTAELMGIGQTHVDTKNGEIWKYPVWISAMFPQERAANRVPVALIDHQYVSLKFSLPVLRAMKTHGMANAQENSFISTNDMVTAVGWLLKRVLSQERTWNVSVVMNLRGRCGVGGFDDERLQRTGLFGNAITNVVAQMEPTPHATTRLRKRDARKAAYSIRQAMQEALLDIPDQLARSRLGIRNDVTSSGETFSTTSWGQLSPWKISFGDDVRVSAFHGQPAHPLPVGRTFSSVIQNALDGTCTYELFLPSDKADKARELHSELCLSYLKWYNKQNQNGRNIV